MIVILEGQLAVSIRPGINDAGDIVGQYNIGRVTHGFLGAPVVPEPASLTLCGIGLLGLGLA